MNQLIISIIKNSKYVVKRRLCLWIVLLLFSLVDNAQETNRFKEISKAFLSPDSKIILIASHRGVHNELPENSCLSLPIAGVNS